MNSLGDWSAVLQRPNTNSTLEKGIMNRPRQFCSAIVLFALCTVSASAQVNVNYPVNGAVVAPQFSLYATSGWCSNQWIAAMGFSLDSSADVNYVFNSSIYSPVNAPQGWHVLHVKAWGNQGAVCVTDVNISVTGSGTTASASTAVAPSGVSGPYVPPYAAVVGSIQTLGNWVSFHDSGTYGYSTGAMANTGSPSLSGNALLLYTTYDYYGGQRYYASFGDDTNARNFVYDGWIYLTNSSGSISNLEMDMNQVMPNGQTVIFGFQCDGWSGTWDYSANGGTPSAPWDHWVTSNAPCNVRNWAQNAWHHVQISYSRDDYGTVTYHSVWLDGNEQQINATVPSAYNLGWAPTLVTNFQVGSFFPGWSSSTVYLDNLTVSRW
jgi:hypothetical protein